MILVTYVSHALVQFGGPLGVGGGAGNDQWSCNIRVRTHETALPGNDHDLSVEEQEEYCEDVVVPALTTWWANSNNQINNNARLSYVKVNAIAPDGKYFNEDATTVHDFANLQPADGVFNNYKGLQVSKVFSLMTAKKRGRAHIGRIYLPSPANVVSADGYATLSGLELEAFATFIAALNAEIGITPVINLVPAVISKLGDPTGDGEWNPITAVAQDDVLDTQRRRTNQLARTRYVEELP
jgi:hypothetical protein